MRNASSAGCWMLVALLLGISTGVPAQSLDEIERQIEAAKREQAEKAAAEKREAEARASREAAARRETEAAAAAAAAIKARMGTLVVRADAYCELSVNVERKGMLTADGMQRIRVEPGESLIECEGKGGRRAEATERILSGDQEVVRLTVPPPSRFTQRAEGIFDAEQNLVWAASDNGSDIDLKGARSYCAAKGSG